MNKHIGSSLDSFLADEGLFEQTEAKAIKAVLAMSIARELESERITKTQLAQKMNTSRASVHRLLDPANTSVTLNSIVKAMGALGKKIQISIA